MTTICLESPTHPRLDKLRESILTELMFCCFCSPATKKCFHNSKYIDPFCFFLTFATMYILSSVAGEPKQQKLISAGVVSRVSLPSQ